MVNMPRCASFAVFVCVLVMCAPAMAKGRTPTTKLNLEKSYIARVIGKERSVRQDGLTPTRLAPAIIVIDLDHDGIPDYLVDYNKVINSHWCGTGGCSFELWRGTKGGHPVRVWDEMVREYNVTHRNGETVFDFDFHGSNCGTYGAAACPASFAWDPRAGRLAERATPKGDTTVRLIDPIPLGRSQIPRNILQISLAATAKCKANGTDDEILLPVSIPDVDGDGLRDWALTIAICDKPGDYDLRQMLFATVGNEQHPTMVASGAHYSISFRTKPATVAQVLKTEECEGYSVEADAKICTRIPMVWNGTTKRLEIAVGR